MCRYVPGAVAERVLRGDVLEPSEREVSVLFVDIRDYTRVAERLHAADVFATLNEHTERVSSVVQTANPVRSLQRTPGDTAPSR